MFSGFPIFFPFIITSPTQPSFSHVPIHSLTTVVVSFESKRIIKMLKSEKEELTVFATSLLFTNVQSFHSTPCDSKENEVPTTKEQQHKKRKGKKKKKLQWLTHRVLFLFTVHSLNKNPIYCSNLNPLASQFDFSLHNIATISRFTKTKSLITLPSEPKLKFNSALVLSFNQTIIHLDT